MECVNQYTILICKICDPHDSHIASLSIGLKSWNIVMLVDKEPAIMPPTIRDHARYFLDSSFLVNWSFMAKTGGMTKPSKAADVPPMSPKITDISGTTKATNNADVE